MPAPLIPIALALAQFAPSVLRFLGAGAASTTVADQVAGIARSVTGAATPERALDMLRQDVLLAKEFGLAVLRRDGELEQAFLADREDAYLQVSALRELFGLDAATEPEAAEDADVASLDDRRRGKRS